MNGCRHTLPSVLLEVKEVQSSFYLKKNYICVVITVKYTYNYYKYF